LRILDRILNEPVPATVEFSKDDLFSASEFLLDVGEINKRVVHQSLVKRLLDLVVNFCRISVRAARHQPVPHVVGFSNETTMKQSLIVQKNFVPGLFSAGH
jgi:hypothetical protein